MSSYYFGSFCALLAARALDAIKADRGVWSHIRFWLLAGLVSALMVSCGDPIPFL